MNTASQNVCPVWVLNLERSTARRHFMEEQLQHQGIEFEFIQAIDGTNLSNSHLNAYSKQAAMQVCGRELSYEEIGCALSHASMWHRIVTERHAAVLVLEDDVIIERDLFALLQYRHAFPSDWEYINFLTEAPKIPFGGPIYHEHRFCQFKWRADGTCAYLLNARGAQKLLRHTYPIRWPADGITCRTYLTDVVSYGTVPQVVRLSDFESDIGHDDNEPPYKRSRKILLAIFDAIRYFIHYQKNRKISLI